MRKPGDANTASTALTIACTSLFGGIRKRGSEGGKKEGVKTQREGRLSQREVEEKISERRVAADIETQLRAVAVPLHRALLRRGTQTGSDGSPRRSLLYIFNYPGTELARRIIALTALASTPARGVAASASSRRLGSGIGSIPAPTPPSPKATPWCRRPLADSPFRRPCVYRSHETADGETKAVENAEWNEKSSDSDLKMQCE
jgi:hypothetical protein